MNPLVTFGALYCVATCLLSTDTVERKNSDLELSPLRYWQPLENITKSRRDVVILASADDICT